MPYFAKSNLFGSAISINAILKISFLKIVFLKLHRHLVKHVKKYFFIIIFFLSIECLDNIRI